MIFIAALYFPWCRCLAAEEGVEPQLYADNLKCVCHVILMCFCVLLGSLLGTFGW